MRAPRAILALTLTAAMAACSDSRSVLPAEQTPDVDLARCLVALPRNPWTAPAGPPVLVGAGDIARCYDPENPAAITPPHLTAAESTAMILDRIPGTVMALGDNAYEFGSPSEYLLCYEPTWGRHKDRKSTRLNSSHSQISY